MICLSPYICKCAVLLIHCHVTRTFGGDDSIDNLTMDIVNEHKALVVISSVGVKFCWLTPLAHKRRWTNFTHFHLWHFFEMYHHCWWQWSCPGVKVINDQPLTLAWLETIGERHNMYSSPLCPGVNWNGHERHSQGHSNLDITICEAKWQVKRTFWTHSHPLRKVSV